MRIQNTFFAVVSAVFVTAGIVGGAGDHAAAFADNLAVSDQEHVSKLRSLETLAAQIKTNPGDVHLYIERAAVYQLKKRFLEAKQDYVKALGLDPRQPMAYEGVGEVYFKTGQYASALQFLNRAISLDSKVGDSYFYRGSTYKALGKNVEADKDFQRAAKLGYKPGLSQH